jgi:hypothetical protein
MNGPFQFGLSLLLMLVSCLCIVLAMWNWYWWIGLWLAVPHMVMIAIGYWLWRSSRKRFAIASAVTYGALWLGTALVGIPQVTADVTREQDKWFPQARRIAHLPLGSDLQMRHPRPWKSIGNLTVPCPFVVTVDCAFRQGGTFGYGGREFKLVLPGRSWHLETNLYWLS